MLTEYAAIAEIISSIAVILSLLFVGFQLREGNRQARAAAIQDAMAFEMENSGRLADHASTWDKIIRGIDLGDGEELRRAILLFNMLISECENRYHQYNQGYLNQQTWEGRLRSLRGLVTLPFYQTWRESYSGISHSADFLKLVDDLSSSGKPV